MKCIKHGGAIKRVEDAQADTLVSQGTATYTTKKEWKEANPKAHKQRQAETQGLQALAAARKKAKEASGS